jgi:hypothetical protein
MQERMLPSEVVGLDQKLHQGNNQTMRFPEVSGPRRPGTAHNNNN